MHDVIYPTRPLHTTHKTAKIFPKRIVVAKTVPHIYKNIEKKNVAVVTKSCIVYGR